MSCSLLAMTFPLLARKPLQVDFNGGLLSSDGGLLLLARLDQKLRLTERVAACLHDPRLKERIQHPLLDLLRQRSYQIAAGYEDANDATSLRHDPALKLAVGRCPTSDPDLASQPTLSRLEKSVTSSESQAINALFLELFLEQQRKAPRELILDFDTSAFPTHGQQAFAFFNAHYDTYCYLPLFVFASVPGEGQESLVSAELRPCDAKEVEGILVTLKRLVERLRTKWPHTKLIFRGDGWFATPELYEWCESHQVAYLIGIAGNRVLQEKSQRWQQEAEGLALASPTKSAKRYGRVSYRARGWSREREVIVKAEVTPLGKNPRYVVVWGVNGKPRRLYERYGQRGGCENRIKEIKEGVRADRMSCQEWEGNEFRLMLGCVAYQLFVGLRRLAKGTELGRAQVEKLRLCLIKIGARVRESLRRVRIELCSSCPSQEVFRELARRLGVVSG
jgi:Transposase DDE domain group 1